VGPGSATAWGNIFGVSLAAGDDSTFELVKFFGLEHKKKTTKQKRHHEGK
jgi:hypothetical protein